MRRDEYKIKFVIEFIVFLIMNIVLFYKIFLNLLFLFDIRILFVISVKRYRCSLRKLILIKYLEIE